MDQPLKVIYSGFVFEPTGYGAAARAYVHALHTSLELSVLSRSNKGWRPVDDVLAASLLDRPINAAFFLCHTEPPDIVQPLIPPRRLIGITTFESDRLPSHFVTALNQLREVWVPSRYNVESFRSQLAAPVFRFPHPMRELAPSPEHQEETFRRFGIDPDDFVVLSVATWQERKNLAGVAEAFFRAFHDQPKVKLVLKTSFGFVNMQAAGAQMAKAFRRAGLSISAELFEARVRVLQGFWPTANMDALLRRADCYLSLHRSEGWCYPLFDAACLGTPVVATGFSGPMDYLDARFHRLVRYEIVPATRGDDPSRFPFSEDMHWAEPDIVHAAGLLREVYENSQAREQAAAGAALLRQSYAPEEVGRMARERLLELLQSE